MTEQGEPGDPEPLETGACLIVAGFVFAAVCVVGDALKFLDDFRRWWQ